ncbi:CinA family protein [Loktanella sp. M215]|uniref:CinA family protein n=1 Tax=Loktanella sp. M215 TaxID=2675431 RepID=UPI001F1C078D|nr:CinA family protein [Loktanella sp. M215]MCF7700225.1 nicotinamide-nucleotide amidohydrolase family protein [Loktanella sp. M215]
MSKAAQLLELAKDRGIVIALAESCTGGLIAGAITEVAGSSAIFDRGFVTYTNAAKMQMLGVLSDTLDDFGAVSEEVAREMAQGAFDNSEAQIALSVTGIAGPGGSEHKPEGRVCFGVATGDGMHTQTVEFGAIGRAQVRAATVDHALDLLLAGVMQFPVRA